MMARLHRFIWMCVTWCGLWFPVLAAEQEPVKENQEKAHILLVPWRSDTQIEMAWRRAMEESHFPYRTTSILADQDRGRLINGLRATYRDLFNGKVDLVCCFGTTACQVVRQVTIGRAPVLFIGVVDPIGAGLVSSLTLPGNKISGVASGPSVDQQLSVLHQITSFRDLLFLFNSRESYSVLIGHEIAIWAQERGLRVEDRRVVPDSVGLDEILSDIFTGDFTADAIYVADDNYVASRAREIADTIGTKTLLFAGSDEFIQSGWLAGWIPSSEDVGRVAAEMTLEVLRDGFDPGIIPVRIPKASLFLNKDASGSQDFSIPKTSTLAPYVKYITSQQ